MKNLSKQQGIALLVIVTLLATAAAAVTVTALNRSSQNVHIARDKITAAALAQAKEALIGYAAAVKISSSVAANQPRPGDLPCPDTDNDGMPGDATYTTCNLQSQRIGRLPWKKLGLPDLRDGSGERLWYAVSTNFKNSSRIGTLNSDTVGTISVLAPGGTTRLNDGGGNTGAVAVILAPGDILKRSDQPNPQDRSNTGINDPRNYLEIATVGGNTEDNANFTDSLSTNGFIQGRIKDGIGNMIFNDQLLVITQDNIMQVIQKRVAGEVKQCLIEYASINSGRYPWAVPLTDFVSYSDSTNQLFGRIPKGLGNTKTDSGNGMNSMNSTWGPACDTHNINTPSNWWLNWQEMVFYGLADAYKPVNPPSTPTTCPTCLTVNPPSAVVDKKFVVIIAGKKLAGQTRTSNADKGILNNYLEAPNSGGATTFAQGPFSTIFNDTVVFP